MASHAIPFLEKQNNKIEKGCELYGKNKGKLSGQVPHCDFYFVALPVLLMKRFSIRVPILNLQPLGTSPIDSATPMCQPPPPPPPPQPFESHEDTRTSLNKILADRLLTVNRRLAGKQASS